MQNSCGWPEMTYGEQKRGSSKQWPRSQATLTMHPSMPISFGALVMKEPVFLSALLMTPIIKFCNLGELRLS